MIGEVSRVRVTFVTIAAVPRGRAAFPLEVNRGTRHDRPGQLLTLSSVDWIPDWPSEIPPLTLWL
jgi:hypothetical protein